MEESNGTLFPARRPASAGGTGKLLFPLSWIFLPVIAACSAGPVPSERAKAFQGMIREKSLSREEAVRREPAAGDTAGIQALLDGLRNEMSRG
jgi:hypothetical protein